MELTAWQKLDAVLSVFPYESLNANIQPDDFPYIDSLLKKKGISFDPNLLHEMLIRLSKDGYIRHHRVTTNGEKVGIKYALMFDGYMLKENGGYVKQNELDCAEIERGKTNEKYMVAGAIGAALFSGLYLAWTVYAFGIDHHWWVNPCSH